MDLTDEEAIRQAEELIAAADEIMSRPGASADIAARLEKKWAEITGGEERSEREIAARARAAQLLAKADEALSEPRPHPLDADERERAWKRHEEARRAQEEREAWLAGVEEREAGKQPKQKGKRPRASDVMTFKDYDEALRKLLQGISLEFHRQATLLNGKIVTLQLRIDALEKGIRDDD